MILGGRRQGQVSIEFLVVLAMVLMLFVIMGYVIHQKYVRSDDLKTELHGKRIVYAVAESINKISTVGDGYSQYLDLPGGLSGNREYSIVFYRGEPKIFLQGSSLVGGSTMVWSAPLFNQEIYCVLGECNNRCNKTRDQLCLQVNDSLKIRASNYEGAVYLTYPYNLYQRGTGSRVIPYRGSADALMEGRCFTDPLNLSTDDSVMYLYRRPSRFDLVIKHGKSDGVEYNIEYRLSDVLFGWNLSLSDDSGEIDMASMEANWTWSSPDDVCDGGVLSFSDNGVHLCIQPINVPASVNWVWLNGDGTVVNLSKEAEVCITYP